MSYPVGATWTLALDPPIESSGMSCAELKLRTPTVGDWLRATAAFGSGSTLRARADMQIALVEAVTGVSRQVLDRVPWPVLRAAAEWLEDFSSPSPPTTPS